MCIIKKQNVLNMRNQLGRGNANAKSIEIWMQLCLWLCCLHTISVMPHKKPLVFLNKILGELKLHLG